MADTSRPQRIDLQPREGAGGAQSYELLDELGRGGVGVVYRARDPRSSPSRRDGSGRLCWDTVWGGLWIVTAQRALWRPLRPR